MKKTRRTPAGDALTGVMLDFFRLNSLIQTSGDRLVARLGLTSARWQILGAIVAAERPQPVAWLARDLGANRQNVQRIINDLHRDGLVAFETNPHHRRAQLVLLTEKGKRAFDDAMELQAPWINNLWSKPCERSWKSMMNLRCAPSSRVMPAAWIGTWSLRGSYLPRTAT
jgi:DNA-binding MarR family transcriptional regulator